MPPKTNVNAQKQEMILAWFRKTGLAYSIKDLEKLLPSVASINGMVVKEYIQALLGDDSINTEKISNVGWYWSFSSQTKREKENLLAKAQELHDKASAASAELQTKVDQAGAARAEDEGLLAGTGGDRKALVIKYDELHHEVEKLRLELATFSEHDPVELCRKVEETQRLRAAAEQSTEHIYCMEGWLKERVLDRESQVHFLKECYGEEWDDEEGGIREL